MEKYNEDAPFGPAEEDAIVSLAFDLPGFFNTHLKYLKPEHFQCDYNRFVFTLIQQLYGVKEAIPSRGMARDLAMRALTADDPHEEILGTIDRVSDCRDVELIKERMMEWAKHQEYGRLFEGREGYDAWRSGNYDLIDEVVQSAHQLADINDDGFWFFQNFDELFIEEERDHLTTGYIGLDQHLNDGGPSPGEVFVWCAPTGVGKSIFLVNSGAANVRQGRKVLHITLELSRKKTGLRYMGVFTSETIKTRQQMKGKIERKLKQQAEAFDGDLAIYEFPPDEISVDQIYGLIHKLKSEKNWKPDVVIIDYLELMVSRVKEYNKDEYSKQKKVSTEIRGLAKKEDVLIFTATQTNRGKTERGEAVSAVIDISRVAESYGKTMPMDYLVTINQTTEEYDDDIPIVRLFIAKNRNGAKFKTVEARINYSTMQAIQNGDFQG